MDSSYLNGLSDVFNDYSDIYNKNSSAGNIKISWRVQITAKAQMTS